MESEGEQIETVRIHEDDIDAFLLDGEKKSAGIFMAMYWWRHLRHREWNVC